MMAQTTKSISFKIEREIEKSIRDRSYDIGQKLPTENEFCTSFSVSRTAVREALQGLKAKGLIEIRKGSGAYVTALSVQSAIDPINLYFEMSGDNDLIKNAIQTRQAFEPEIAGLAAKNRTSKHIRAIEENLAQLVDCPLEETEIETEIDGDFHSLIAISAGNPIITLIMKPIHHLMPKQKKLIYGKNDFIAREEIKESVVRFHTRIYDAIKEKDTREAYYQMKEHLRMTEKYSKA